MKLFIKNAARVLLYGFLVYAMVFAISAKYFPHIANLQFNGPYVLYLRISCLYSRVIKGTNFTLNGAEIRLPKNWCVLKNNSEEITLISGVHYYLSRVAFPGGPSLFVHKKALEQRGDLFANYRGKTCLSISDYVVNSIHVYETVSRCNTDFSVYWRMPGIGLSMLDSGLTEADLKLVLQLDRKMISQIEPGKSPEKPTGSEVN